MKSKNILVILTLILLGLIPQDLLGQSVDTIRTLAAVTWKLKKIEVDTNSFTDPTSTDLSWKFDGVGNLYVDGDTTNSVPWRFANNSKIIICEGTSAEQTFNIELLSDKFFIYNVNYTVNGTLYNYRFKMVGN